MGALDFSIFYFLCSIARLNLKPVKCIVTLWATQERCQSGRSGLSRKQVGPSQGLEGSNPSLSVSKNYLLISQGFARQNSRSLLNVVILFSFTRQWLSVLRLPAWH